jgi:cysteine dioxygenase
MITVDKLIEGLCTISDEQFTCENVYQYLNQNPLEPASLQPYLFWSSKHYTRNLIYKNDRFELLAICWEPGQVSQIHNHADQKCWMCVPVGRLKGQNFSVLEIDEKRAFCRLQPTDEFELSDCMPASVDLEEPIHQILNLEDFGQRAVSIHIYSKPFDSCLAYFPEDDSFKQVTLSYTSEYGKLRDGVLL